MTKLRIVTELFYLLLQLFLLCIFTKSISLVLVTSEDEMRWINEWMTEQPIQIIFFQTTEISALQKLDLYKHKLDKSQARKSSLGLHNSNFCKAEISAVWKSTIEMNYISDFSLYIFNCRIWLFTKAETYSKQQN